jgi:hypothetical protein
LANGSSSSLLGAVWTAPSVARLIVLQNKTF